MKKEVKVLLGDPKKAVLKISWPMMLGMLVQSLYNFADGAWVAGLGTDQLSAIGLFFPFFMILVAVGMGLGVGGGSAISRRIGERNKQEADNTALHTLIFGVGISLILSLLLLPFLKPLFVTFSNSERVGGLAAEYSAILVGGSAFMIFNNLANAILRSEGDSKRAMYVQVLGAVLNIFLDPLFIYGFDLGIKGAAWATLVSIMSSSLIFSYWLFFKKNTYLDLTIRDFRYSNKIIAEILSVGIPSIFAQFSMSISMIFMNKIVIWTAGTDGVAILTSGWRIITMGTIPIMGLASGASTVCAAAYGARNKEKLKITYFYSIKIALLIEFIIGSIVFIFADKVAILFAYSESSANIYKDLITFLRIMVFIYPSIPFGMISSSLFQGMKKGGRSLTVTILRTIILQIPFTWILGIYFQFGLIGVWSGIVAGNFIAVMIAFIWARKSLSNIKWQVL